MAILEGHKYFNLFGSIHHIYDNDAVFAALKQSKSFPKGSVLVFDLLEARTENSLIELYEAWNKPEKAEEWRAKLPQTEAVEE